MTANQYPILKEISEAERRIWLPPPRPGILEYTRATFILPEKTSRISGPWSDDYTPYVRRPLELFEKPPVRIWISACRQGGKSTLIGIGFNYVVRCDPGPTGIVLPQEQLAKDRIRTKWRPLFAKNPDLLKKLGGDVRNLLIGEPTDLGDMLLYLCWATSVATLSDRSIQNMFYDEAVLFAVLEATGEDPVEYGRDRQTTFEMIARELGVSSAGDEGDIHDRQMRAGSDEQWYVPCMKKGCGRWHPLETYVWDGEKEDEKFIVLDRPGPGRFYPADYYEQRPGSARYVCPHCGKSWSDGDRWKSNKEGQYISMQKELDEEGNRTGQPRQSMDENGKISGPEPTGPQYSFTWHAMMLYPPYGPVHKLAAEFVRARHRAKMGDLSLMRKWVRSRRAKPFRQVARTMDPIRIEEEKKNDCPMGQVPRWVRVLTASADYHQDRMGNVRVDFEVRGWGMDLRNCKILHGHAGSLEEMFRATTTCSFPWQPPKEGESELEDKPELMICCGFIDARYQPEDPEDRTAYVVYDFCRRYWRLRIWHPIMGGKPSQVERFIIKDLEREVEKTARRYKRRTASRYQGMQLIILAVSQFKDLVTRMAEAPMDSPGSTSFAVDTPSDYFREFTNEHKVKNKKTGRWQWQVKKEGLPTHGLDLGVYSVAAGFFRKVDTLWSDEQMDRIRQAAADRGAGQRPAGKEVIDRRTRRAIRTKY